MRDFQNIIGNAPLLSRIRTAVREGALSHAYLISGPAGSGRYTLASTLAAAIVCEGDALRPCGGCRHCRKAGSGIHPDITVIDREEGRREIYVEQVRALTRDAPIFPNEAEKKVYLIKNAQALNLSAQNALLKLLEEPPPHLSILLLCQDQSDLLPTVRSRCVVLSMTPVTAEQAALSLKERYPSRSAEELDAAAAQSGGLIGQAMAYLDAGSGTAFELAAEFVRLLPAREPLACLTFSLKLEKLDKETFADFLRQSRAMLIKLMGEKSAATPPARVMPVLSLLEKAQTLLEYNVGTAHIAGLIAVKTIS